MDDFSENKDENSQALESNHIQEHSGFITEENSPVTSDTSIKQDNFTVDKLENCEKQVETTTSQTIENFSTCGHNGDDTTQIVDENIEHTTTKIDTSAVVHETEQLNSDQFADQSCPSFTNTDSYTTDIIVDEQAVPLIVDKPQDMDDKTVQWKEETEQVIQSTGQGTILANLYNTNDDIQVCYMSTLEKDQISGLGKAISGQVENQDIISTSEQFEVDSSEQLCAHGQLYVDSEFEITEKQLENEGSLNTEAISSEVEPSPEISDISSNSKNGETEIQYIPSTNMESMCQEGYQNGSENVISFDGQTPEIESMDKTINIDTTVSSVNGHDETTTHCTDVTTSENIVHQTFSENIVITTTGESALSTEVESFNTDDMHENVEAEIQEAIDDHDQGVVSTITTVEHTVIEKQEKDAVAVEELDLEKDENEYINPAIDEDGRIDENNDQADVVVAAVPITITTPSEDSEEDSEAAIEGVISESKNHVVTESVDHDCSEIITDKEISDEISDVEGMSTTKSETVSRYVDESGCETIITETVVTTVTDDNDEEIKVVSEEEEPCESGNQTVEIIKESCDDDENVITTTSQAVSSHVEGDSGETIITRTVVTTVVTDGNDDITTEVTTEGTPEIESRELEEDVGAEEVVDGQISEAVTNAINDDQPSFELETEEEGNFVVEEATGVAGDVPAIAEKDVATLEETSAIEEDATAAAAEEAIVDVEEAIVDVEEATADTKEAVSDTEETAAAVEEQSIVLEETSNNAEQQISETTETVSSQIDEAGGETIITKTVVTTLVTDDGGVQITKTTSETHFDEENTPLDQKAEEVTVVTTVSAGENDQQDIEPIIKIGTTEEVHAEPEVTLPAEADKDTNEEIKNERKSSSSSSSSSSSDEEEEKGDVVKEKAAETPVVVESEKKENESEITSKSEDDTVETTTAETTVITKTEEVSSVEVKTIVTTKTVEIKNDENTIETVTTTELKVLQDPAEADGKIKTKELDVTPAVLEVETLPESDKGEPEKETQETEPLLKADEEDEKPSTENQSKGKNGNAIEDSDKETSSLLGKNEKPLKEEEDCTCCVLM